MYDDTDDTDDIWDSYPLGDDTYCETCGNSYNEVEVTSVLHDGGLGRDWKVSMRTGCTGGMEVYGLDVNHPKPEELEKLYELFALARQYPLWNVSIEDDIRQKLGLPTSP